MGDDDDDDDDEIWELEAGLPPITPGNYYLKEILLGATPHPKGINGEKLLKAKRKKKPGIPT